MNPSRTRAVLPIVIAAACVVALGALARAEDPPPTGAPTTPVASPSPRATAPPGISDNSFLLEEAYNQERGVVQHINGLTRFGAANWVYTFTQEWPLPAETHQLSYTIAVLDADQGTGFGDVALNYRYQVVDRGHTAVAPRLTVFVPTGSYSRGRGAGGLGVQTNVPLSLSLGHLAAHTNLGATLVPRARDAAGEVARTLGWNAGQSVIWLARPAFNALVEVAFAHAPQVIAPHRTVATDVLFVSPGLRWAWNFRSGLQIVPGLAFPLGVGPSSGQHGVFLYLSFEHPFRKTREPVTPNG
jgi:hypothetical protein